MSYCIDKEKCTGCEACLCICPCGAIRKEGDVCVIDRDLCAECGACEEECPFEAIEDKDE
jgi:uncharacterized Fe-S center protein